MDLEDFFGFVTAAAGLLFPWGAIYFLLRSLNWNGRKNLFLDSFAVYIALPAVGVPALIVSGLIGYVLGVVGPSPRSIHPFAPLAVLTVSFGAAVSAVAAVLYVRSRPQPAYALTAAAPEPAPAPTGLQIWKTALLVSFLTALLTIGFIFAAADLWARLTPKNENPTTFGIYE